MSEIIIGFTHKTSKIIPRILCRHFRHCAVIVSQKVEVRRQKYIMIQTGFFTHKLIILQKRDLKILEQYGWVFIKLSKTSAFCPLPSALTCVSFAKRMLGIRAPFMLTPDQLYRYLEKENYSVLDSICSN